MALIARQHQSDSRQERMSLLRTQAEMMLLLSSKTFKTQRDRDIDSVLIQSITSLPFWLLQNSQLFGSIGRLVLRVCWVTATS